MKIAMILAAGRGERLRPLTDKIPKALFKAKDRPLIEHHVLRLAQSGFDRVVVNHAYLGGQIRQHLGNGEQLGVEICYSPEPPGGLETGGGIVNALPLLGDEPFLVVNADVFTDFDFASLDLKRVKAVHFVLSNKEPALKHLGDFGLIDGFKPTNTNPEYIYAGITCYHPQVFSQAKQGRYGVTPLVRRLVEEGKASAELHQGNWFDVGSLERLDALNKHLAGRF